ncbi:uncharacterized protein TNCV_4499591 [Trichonephila clavipes]|nr:uncharacterized protein TNCV_4499591 [Trichonephila clavipes]
MYFVVIASIGWLDRWKKRHGVRQLTITGEKLSSDFDAAKEYVTTFANLIAEGNYSPQQIYDADETGLNFRALPKKSLASQEEKSAQPMDQCVLQKLKQIYRKQFLRTLIEDDTVSLIAKIKQTNMKDVVYWSAESWENVTDQTLIKFSKKLWPILEYAENQPENDVTSLLQQVQTIPGCEEAGERDINNWIEEDGETAKFLTNDDIAAAVTQEPMEEEGEILELRAELMRLHKLKKDVVPHADGAAALDLALRYLEQQPDTTPADVLFMRRWRNYASSKDCLRCVRKNN